MVTTAALLKGGVAVVFCRKDPERAKKGIYRRKAQKAAERVNYVIPGFNLVIRRRKGFFRAVVRSWPVVVSPHGASCNRSLWALVGMV